MNEKKARGDRGERAVAAYLAERGYRLLARNFRCRWGEIDLIAADPDGTLCFVEVKTRSAGAIALPRESVTPAKQRKLRLTAECYLVRRRLDCPCRFDVAEVFPGQSGDWAAPEINYIMSAFA